MKRGIIQNLTTNHMYSTNLHLFSKLNLIIGSVPQSMIERSKVVIKSLKSKRNTKQYTLAQALFRQDHVWNIIHDCFFSLYPYSTVTLSTGTIYLQRKDALDGLFQVPLLNFTRNQSKNGLRAHISACIEDSVMPHYFWSFHN